MERKVEVYKIIESIESLIAVLVERRQYLGKLYKILIQVFWKCRKILKKLYIYYLIKYNYLSIAIYLFILYLLLY